MIDCKKISKEIKDSFNIPANIGLAIVQIGDDVGSGFYVRNKVKDCESLNIPCYLYKKESSTTEALLNLIRELNHREDITGIIVQLPLPKNIDTEKVLAAIDSQKDVDGFKTDSPYMPCTPKGILEVLKYEIPDLTSQKVTLIGRGKTVGKPLRDLLIDENVTLSVCHSKTKYKDFFSLVKNADIIISCTGKPNLITKEMVNPNQIIIDVGISRIDGKQVGDVSKAVWDIANCTPWVNGIGLMTRTALLQNLVLSAEM